MFLIFQRQNYTSLSITHVQAILLLFLLQMVLIIRCWFSKDLTKPRRWSNYFTDSAEKNARG